MLRHVKYDAGGEAASGADEAARVHCDPLPKGEA
jgi:hypothetical protein